MSKALIRCGLTILLAIAVSGCTKGRMGLPAWNPFAKNDEQIPILDPFDSVPQSQQIAEKRFTGSNAENVADAEASSASLRNQMAADERPDKVDWKVRGRNLPQTQPRIKTAAATPGRTNNTVATLGQRPAWWGNEPDTPASELADERPFEVAAAERPAMANVNSFAATANDHNTPDSIRLIGGQREELAQSQQFRERTQTDEFLFGRHQAVRQAVSNQFGNSYPEFTRTTRSDPPLRERNSIDNRFGDAAGKQSTRNLPPNNIPSEQLPRQNFNTPPIADPAEQGRMLYQADDFAGAERNFRAIDLTALPARDRLPIQYLIANCLKKQAQELQEDGDLAGSERKLSESVIWYRRVAQSGIDDVLVEQSRWNLNNMKLQQPALDSANTFGPPRTPNQNPFATQ